jgi:hypothetical protein
MIVSDTPANAEQVVSAIYSLMRAHTEVGQLPDGTQLLEFANGYLFRIFDDPDVWAPNGISWWLDGPRGNDPRGSDGWEKLTLSDLDGPQIVSLAGYLDAVAQRKCEAHDGEQ